MAGLPDYMAWKRNNFLIKSQVQIVIIPYNSGSPSMVMQTLIKRNPSLKNNLIRAVQINPNKITDNQNRKGKKPN